MKEEPIIKVGTWKGWSFLAAALTENIRKGRLFTSKISVCQNTMHELKT